MLISVCEDAQNDNVSMLVVCRRHVNHGRHFVRHANVCKLLENSVKFGWYLVIIINQSIEPNFDMMLARDESLKINTFHRIGCL